MNEVREFIKETIGIVNGEIEWCKKNKGISQNGKEFEKGFAEGLKQAKRLIRLSAKGEQ